MYLIIYKKPGGENSYKLLRYFNLKVGDVRDSSQWLVISKGILDNNKFISECDYLNRVEKQNVIFHKKRKISKKIKTLLTTFTFVLLFLFLIYNVVIKFVIYIFELIF